MRLRRACVRRRYGRDPVKSRCCLFGRSGHFGWRNWQIIGRMTSDDSIADDAQAIDVSRDARHRRSARRSHCSRTVDARTSCAMCRTMTAMSVASTTLESRATDRELLIRVSLLGYFARQRFIRCIDSAEHGSRRDNHRPTSQGYLPFAIPAARRAKSHRGGAWRAGRQDRVEPADERDAGGDGAGALPELVRRFRPRPRQTRRPPAHRPRPRHRRSLP